MPIHIDATHPAENEAEFPVVASPSTLAAVPLSRPRSPAQFLVNGLLVVSLLGLAVAMRLHLLMDVSFSYDEACSWRISHFDWPEMWDAISRDAHPPLFYLLQRIWQSLIGTSISAARVLSLLGGLLSTALTYWLATVLAKASPESTGSTQKTVLFTVLATALMALHPQMVHLSQVARPYVWGVCLTLLASGLVFKAVQTPTQIRNWVGFSITTVALSLTHYYGLLTVVALFAFAFIETALRWKSEEAPAIKRSRIAGVLVSVGVGQLFWWPWLETFSHQLHRAGKQFWLPPLDVDSWTTVCARGLSGLDVLTPAVAMSLTLIWLGVPILLLLQRNPIGRLLAFGSAGPLVLATASALLFRNMMEPRYLALALTPLLIGIAWLLATIASPFWQYSAIGLTGCGLLFCCVQSHLIRERMAASPGLQEAAAHLNQNRHHDDPLLVSSPFLMVCLLPLLNEHETIGVRFQGDYQNDLLAGPPIKAEEIARYESILASRPARLWTVDAVNVLGGATDVAVPWEYRPTSQTRFFDSAGFDMEFVVRSYELPARQDLQTTLRDRQP